MSYDDLTRSERFAIWRFRWLPFRTATLDLEASIKTGEIVSGEWRWHWPALRRIRGGSQS